RLWPVFVDAAAGVPSAGDAATRLAIRLADEPPPDRPKSEQVLYLSRLGWVLYREGDRTKSSAALSKAEVLLDRAVKMHPEDPAVRAELAGVLVAARRFTPALALYEALAREFPGDAEYRRRLAEVTVWGGDLE